MAGSKTANQLVHSPFELGRFASLQDRLLAGVNHRVPVPTVEFRIKILLFHNIASLYKDLFAISS